jgi:hypothetical protein
MDDAGSVTNNFASTDSLAGFTLNTLSNTNDSSRQSKKQLRPMTSSLGSQGSEGPSGRSIRATTASTEANELRKVWQVALRICHKADPDRTGLVNRVSFIQSLEAANTGNVSV